MNISPTPQASKKKFRLALIAMPWQLFHRPSIQLGALKAYLEKETDFVQVNAFHPYLDVARRLGGEVYHWVSQNVWVCEALYAALLFPELKPAAKDIVKKALKKGGSHLGFNFDEVTGMLQSQLDGWLQDYPWQDYDLVGFSVCFNQLLASLTAAKALKAGWPNLPIVFGGSVCAPAVGASLLKNFTQIDYVISGEGEKSLVNLCEHLAGRADLLVSEILCTGHGSEQEALKVPAGQIDDLASLPMPDYRDYFAEMQKVFAGEPFVPEIPLEFSRGCWWGKCTFCNLNLQWRGYRHKKAGRMLNEVLALSEAYGALDFSFTDNALPVGDSVKFFEMIRAQERDFHFFGEIRLALKGEKLAAYRKGGLTTVQVGIEGLSNSLLARMQKGVTVIENVAMMKECLAKGIILEGNLITEFPQSTMQEVSETLETLDFVMPYTPLSTAAFFLGHGSPVDCDPKRFGVLAVTHHPQNVRLFPSDILKNLTLLIMDYRGDRAKQRKLWKAVVDKVRQWQEIHKQRKASAIELPMLSYRDGGNFLIIRQELPDKRVLQHRLRGKSRQIYLACDRINSFDSLLKRVSGISSDQLKQFLDDLVQKRLMFAHGGKYLSLAVHRN